ncbi:hypothetical protein ACP4OV_014519 [Aristida adscensionis]
MDQGTVPISMAGSVLVDGLCRSARSNVSNFANGTPTADELAMDRAKRRAARRNLDGEPSMGKESHNNPVTPVRSAPAASTASPSGLRAHCIGSLAREVEVERKAQVDGHVVQEGVGSTGSTSLQQHSDYRRGGSTAGGAAASASITSSGSVVMIWRLRSSAAGTARGTTVRASATTTVSTAATATPASGSAAPRRAPIEGSSLARTGQVDSSGEFAGSGAYSGFCDSRKKTAAAGIEGYLHPGRRQARPQLLIFQN